MQNDTLKFVLKNDIFEILFNSRYFQRVFSSYMKLFVPWWNYSVLSYLAFFFIKQTPAAACKNEHRKSIIYSE